MCWRIFLIGLKLFILCLIFEVHHGDCSLKWSLILGINRGIAAKMDSLIKAQTFSTSQLELHELKSTLNSYSDGFLNKGPDLLHITIRVT